MVSRKRGEFTEGDHVCVMVGNRPFIGTVTRVSGYRVHVSVHVEGADDPFTSLYRADDLVPA